MDTLTHAFSGALLARALKLPGSGIGLNERTGTGFVAAGFPDLDYALFWIAPLEFLNWHRGPTHSLLLLPLWAMLVAGVMRLVGRNRYAWREYVWICALAIGIHIAGDVITIYGTRVLSPWSDRAVALNLVFDLDPYLAAIIGIGFLGALRWRPGPVAVVTLLAVVSYLSLQATMQQRTLELGKRLAQQENGEGIRVYALPQPISPHTWKLVIAQGDGYRVAHLNYLVRRPVTVPEEALWIRRLVAAYRPIDALVWHRYDRLGETEETRALSRDVWQLQGFAAFRRFAVLPALYRVDGRDSAEVCVWFTDLRHVFPTLPPSFRYGMCRDSHGGRWRLYRLRYFRVNERQLLG